MAVGEYGEARIIESNGVFLRSSLCGKKWICFPLPANGRFRTVTWIDDDIVAQAEDLLSHIAQQALIISSRKVGPPDGTRKESIPDKYDLVCDQRNASGRMTWSMEDF